MRFAKVAAVVAVMPMLTAASEPIHLAPSSKWVVDYADDSCRLIRTFGTADDRAILLMERLAPNGSTSLLVVSKYLKTTMGARDFKARFLPNQNVIAVGGQAAQSDDRTPAVLWPSFGFSSFYEDGDPNMPADIKEMLKAAKKGQRPPPPDPAVFAARKTEALTNASKTTSVEIGRKGGKTIVLETGSMGTPWGMLKDCTRNQLVHWGIDPAVDEKIAKPVEAIDPLGWFNSSDYPERSLADFKESQLQVRALVDATGRITKCTPVTRVSTPDFPTKVCQVMERRAKFKPAQLADGTNVPSYYIQTISFRMAN